MKFFPNVTSRVIRWTTSTLAPSRSKVRNDDVRYKNLSESIKVIEGTVISTVLVAGYAVRVDSDLVAWGKVENVKSV